MSKIPIYVVSIKDSPRKKSIEQELKNYSFTYIDAVVGADKNKDYINNINNQEWVKKRYKRKLSPGEIGCALSHIKIYQKMIENDIEWAMIFEDDISIRENIKSLLTISRNLLKKNTLYILGAQQHLDSEKMIITLKRKNLKIDENIIFYDTFLSSKYIYRTAAYLIHKDVAKKILNFTNQKFCIADDWYIFHKYKIFNKIYISNLVYHPDPKNNQSTIEKERNNSLKKRKIIKNILSLCKVKLRLILKKSMRKIYDKL